MQLYVSAIWDATLVRYRQTRPMRWNSLTLELDSVGNVAMFVGRCLHGYNFVARSNRFTETLPRLKVQARIENALLSLEQLHREGCPNAAD